MRYLTLPLAITLVALVDPSAPVSAPSSPTPDARAMHTPDRVFLTSSRSGTDVRGGSTQAVNSLINVRSPMRFGQSVWDDTGQSGGLIWLRVDLKRQLLSVFRNGDEIGSSVIIYGADGKPTPRGTFHVKAMLMDHRSTLYNATMPYTLRLTKDGVAIHGSDVRVNAATHGCIGVPTDFAARLFSVAHLGDTVQVG